MHLRFLTFLLLLAAGLPFRAVLAQATAPTQGGDVSVILVTATTMELHFGTNGTGQGRVVAMAVSEGGMPVPLAAADGRVYTASTVYGKGDALGQGYAVYSGPDGSATITGLQPATYYYITNAEYNTNGSSIAYNTLGTSLSTSTQNAPPASIPVEATLPVELTDFTGTVDARGMAVLHWATAVERDINYFALERSADGIAFAEADQVAAAGTSSQRLAYQWPDPQRLARPTYYRLRQADRDGAVHYSAVVILTPPAPRVRLARMIEVYPNPSAGQLVHLLLQGFEGEALTLHLADALGRPVFAQALTPTEVQCRAQLALPAGLSPGTYVITLAGSGSPVQKRLIVSN